MTAVLVTLTVILAYLLGSVPSAYLVGRRRRGVDIRQVGSRNMGAMNVFYSVGFWWGLLVLALDIGKGAAAVGIATALELPEAARLAAGLVAVLGHIFPVFLGFKGGKGGASCIGVLAVLLPWGIPICIGLFGLVLLVTRWPTFSYGVALLCFPVVGWLHYHRADLAVFAAVLLVIPLVRYIPRLKEMRSKAGNWGRVFRRRGLEERY